METLNYADSLTFDSILSSISEDDLYKCFIQTTADQNNDDVATNQLPNVLEGPEFPDLASIDLSEFFLQPVKPEPIDSPKVSVFNHAEAPDIKRKIPLKDNKLIKKQKLEFKKEVKIEAPKVSKKEDKYQKRLQANKRSAQASRERKKALKVELEQKVDELTEENANLGTQITELETENKVLKNEFIHLQRLICDSSILSKLMAKASSPMPSSNSTQVKETDANLTLPTNSNNYGAAFTYLMVILYSFGQHFNNSTKLPPMLNGLALPPTISTVA